MKAPLLQRLLPRTLRSKLRTSLLPAVLVGAVSAAQAQFPRVESFQNNSATGFSVGGSAALTGGADDPNGAGYLRLTSAGNNQSGYAVDQTAFAAPQGFSISFEFFAYGGTGADGFSCFLFNGTTMGFTPGASGGSLGYAQKTVTPISDGVPNGYIGIGIDEWGNYSNPTEGRVGGRVPGVLPDGRTPDAVSIRGAGNGRSATDYPYLDGTDQLPFSLDVATARAQVGSDDYRRAYIDLVPINGTYEVTVRLQHGNEVTTAIRAIRVPQPPPTLRIGFSGSTGGSTNVHEIRKLAIVRAPFANDDLAGTPFNQSVTLNVLANDLAPGSNFDPSTVDLDINTPGVQLTRTVAGRGTFSVNAQGEVIFTPSGTFSGTVTIPYTVQNVLNDQSSPANITIIVQGADIATTISGPSTANPGSRITYTLNTTNLGTEGATNVTPRITLVPNLPAANITLPAGATYNAMTGVVTFAVIQNIPAGANPVSNSVTFTVPATGVTEINGTGNSVASTPDPVTANNTSTIKTVISGVANVDQVCAEPGKDGPGALTATSIPNTYFPVASGTTLNTGNTSIPLQAAAIGSDDIQAGDIVLIMQMQGATINTSNTTAYGDVTAGATYTAGLYEYAIARNSVTASSGGTLTLVKGLTNNYVNQDYNGTLTGQRRFQVIRVPQYSSLTVTGTVTGAAWNGLVGGVLALDVAGRTSFAAGASLNMDAKGFRGGGGRTLGGSTSFNNQVFLAPAANAAHGSKGEGIAGTPQYTYNGTAVTPNGVEGYLNGSMAQGAPANAGGGATDRNPSSNDGNAGGGGGGNGGAGGLGGYGQGSNGSGARGVGGRSVAGGSASRLFMGGGGGAGSVNETTPTFSSGGVGGGIIILRTSSVSSTGTLQANGGSAPDAGTRNQGGGGGGAGGTVLVLATPPNGIANGLSGLTINVAGGNGSNANTDGNQNNGRIGPGGGGGGGLIYINGSFANAGASTSPVQAGAGGVTSTGNFNFGAGAGINGIITANVDPTTVPLVAGAGDCEPVLTASMSTTTPNVTRTAGAGSEVNPATYVITVANTGGAARNVTVTGSLAPNVVGYDNTFTPVATLTLADGTSSAIAVSLPSANGTSTPQFGDINIPAGATVNITFRATIVSTAQDNFAYQASALVQYLDPTRTSGTTTVQPGGTYQSYSPSQGVGVGAARGSNYAGSTSTNEDVTITRPLPVELKVFSAQAVRKDAVLSWTTAQELNNDHFDVERSFDGREFERIGAVRGQGTTSRPTDYKFTDPGIGRQGHAVVYYRLLQVDADGTATKSPVRSVQFENFTKANVALYPNPAPGHATLDLTGLPAGTYQVQVLDLTGRLVNRYSLSGTAKHALDLLELPQGSYVVRVVGGAVNLALPLTRN